MANVVAVIATDRIVRSDPIRRLGKQLLYSIGLCIHVLWYVQCALCIDIDRRVINVVLIAKIPNIFLLVRSRGRYNKYIRTRTKFPEGREHACIYDVSTYSRYMRVSFIRERLFFFLFASLLYTL